MSFKYIIRCKKQVKKRPCKRHVREKNGHCPRTFWHGTARATVVPANGRGGSNQWPPRKACEGCCYSGALTAFCPLGTKPRADPIMLGGIFRGPLLTVRHRGPLLTVRAAILASATSGRGVWARVHLTWAGLHGLFKTCFCT